MTEAQRWQPLAAKELDEPQPPHLRMSSAGKCPRAIAFATAETSESNPPDAWSTNRMAMGDMAEILIVRNLEENGWETRHTIISQDGQLEVELEVPDTGHVMRGHPDGICRHPEFTKGIWVPLECKSMSIERAHEVRQKGVAAVYPSYIAQISLYGMALKNDGLINFPDRGIFGMMDRDGRPLPPERVAWSQEYTHEILEKLKWIIDHVDRGELPERPYAQNSTECLYCSYHSACWDTLKPPTPEPQDSFPSQIYKDPQLAEAARTWAELKPQVDSARDKLQEACNQNDKKDITLEGVIAGYFQPREVPVYDPFKLEKFVTADILRNCAYVREEQKPAFWVRKDRK